MLKELILPIILFIFISFVFISIILIYDVKRVRDSIKNYEHSLSDSLIKSMFKSGNGQRPSPKHKS